MAEIVNIDGEEFVRLPMPTFRYFICRRGWWLFWRRVKKREVTKDEFYQYQRKKKRHKREYEEITMSYREDQLKDL